MLHVRRHEVLLMRLWWQRILSFRHCIVPVILIVVIVVPSLILEVVRTFVLMGRAILVLC